MRSPGARLIFGVLACLALGGAAFFLFTGQRLIHERRAASRAFDLAARQVTYSLADLRAAQQGYVAAGQGDEVWAPKVEALLQSATTAVNSLRATATSASARGVLLEATANLTSLSALDQRIREYLDSGQRLMAADVVFAEAQETVLAVVRQVEAAMLAEHQALDLAERAIQQQQILTAGGLAALAVLLVGFLASRGSAAVPADLEPLPKQADASAEDDLSLRPEPQPQLQETLTEPPRAAVPALKAAAEICTEFGCAKDVEAVDALLARASQLLDAGGVIVWMGSPGGAALQPVLAHGYAPDKLARMPPVPRDAANAAAEAYRTGRLQIVLARPGVSAGAIVAPLLSADGCVGALTAEITKGSEASDTVQAFAEIFAAQLAVVLAPSAAARDTHEDTHRDRMASA